MQGTQVALDLCRAPHPERPPSPGEAVRACGGDGVPRLCTRIRGEVSTFLREVTELGHGSSCGKAQLARAISTEGNFYNGNADRNHRDYEAGPTCTEKEAESLKRMTLPQAVSDRDRHRHGVSLASVASIPPAVSTDSRAWADQSHGNKGGLPGGGADRGGLPRSFPWAAGPRHVPWGP